MILIEYMQTIVQCETTTDEMDIQNIPYDQDPPLDHSTFLLSVT